GADVSSSKVRLTLLTDSIQTTLAHPIFGVGPGQFAYQTWLRRKELGLPIVYNETHNTYTQISSELGVPGLIIFLGLLWSCLRAILSVRRLRFSREYRAPQRVLETADSLLLELVVLCVCAMFLSLAYGPLFFFVAAIIASFHRCVQNDLPGWRIPPVAAAPQRVLQKAPVRTLPTPAGAGLKARSSLPK